MLKILPPILCVGFAASTVLAQTSIQVPSFGAAATGTSLGYSTDQKFFFVAQTLASRPGVCYRRCDAAGERWSSPESRVVDRFSSGLEPTVVVLNNDVFLCWVERVTQNRTTTDTLYFDHSTDGGDSWRGPKPMPPSDASMQIVDSYRLVTRVVGTSKHIFVAAQWKDRVGDESELDLIRSKDGGHSFETTMPVATRVRQFALDVTASHVHLAWLGGRLARGTGQTEVLHRALMHGARSLSDVTVLRGGGFQPSARGIALGSRANSLAVAWLEREVAGSDTLHFTSSTNSGQAFHVPRAIGSYRSGVDDVDDPQLRIDHGAKFATLAWTDDRIGRDDVYSAAIDLVGQSVTKDRAVFTAPARHPQLIAVDDAPQMLLTAEVGGDRHGAFTAGTDLWGSSFVMFDATRGELATLASVDYDQANRGLLLSWMVTSSNSARQVIGRARVHAVSALDGGIQNRSFATFALSGFPVQMTGQPFQVLLSLSRGKIDIPGYGVSIDLRADTLMLFSLQLPGLRGNFGQDGRARAKPILIPASAKGVVIHYAAVGLGPMGRAFVTDSRTEQIR